MNEKCVHEIVINDLAVWYDDETLLSLELID